MSFSVSYTYKLRDLYTGPMRKIAAATSSAQKSIGRFATKATDKVAILGSIVGTLGGKKVLGPIVEFETAMNRLRAASAGAGTEQISTARKLSKSLGTMTEFTAAEVADGLASLVKSGLDLDKSMIALPSVLDLASAGMLGIDEAGRIATDTLSQLGSDIGDLVKINDMLSASFINSKLDVETMGRALVPAAGILKFVGFSIEQTAAALSSLRGSGEIPSKAGRGIARAMTEISKALIPGSKKGALLKAIGINIGDFFDIKTKKVIDFPGLIDELKKASKRTGFKQFNLAKANLLFGQLGGKVMIGFLAKGGDALREYEAKYKKAAGTTIKMAKEMRSNIPGDIKRLTSAAEGAALALGDAGLTATLSSAAKKATEFARGLAGLDTDKLNLIGKIGVGVGVSAPILLFLGLFAGAISALMTPLSLLFGAMLTWKTAIFAIGSAVVYLAAKAGKLDPLKVAFVKLGKTMVGLWDSLEPVRKAFGKLFDLVGKPVLKGFAGFIADVLIGTVDLLAESVDGVTSSVGKMLKMFGVETGIDLKGSKTNLSQDIIQAFINPFGGTAFRALGNKNTNLSVNGQINVSADPGSKVTGARVFLGGMPGLDLGHNMIGGGS